MDPSHARKYTKNEIEGIVADLLNAAYPHGVSPPIRIDLQAHSVGQIKWRSEAWIISGRQRRRLWR